MPRESRRGGGGQEEGEEGRKEDHWWRGIQQEEVILVIDNSGRYSFITQDSNGQYYECIPIRFSDLFSGQTKKYYGIAHI